MLSLILTLALLLAADAAASGKAMAPLPPALFGHWVHSFEEDSDAATVYRPRSFAFPAARGREGFELRDNGEFVRHEIARGDGNTPVVGSWKRIGPDTIEVVVTRDGRPEREVLRILSCADGVLKLARR